MPDNQNYYSGANTPQALAYAKVVARVWADDTQLAIFLADPKTYLEGAGVHLPIPAQQQVVVAVNTPGVYHVILPERPAQFAIANANSNVTSSDPNYPDMEGWAISQFPYDTQ